MGQISRREVITRSAGAAAALMLGRPFMAEASTVAASEPVTIGNGMLVGTREPNGTRVWRGIPYAQPPVGKLRGRAPQPVADWAGKREAIGFGPMAIQQPIGGGDAQMPEGSEDCLYLNVWAPESDSDTPRPVLVWIHGGGYVLGSGSDPLSVGDDYAARGDLIYVTLNYRLHGFGFLQTAREKGSANMALLDQIAALRWIQENIAAFGGDPAQVTVMGESAGAMAISTLMGAPLARGLFSRAILQSGGARPIYSQEDAQQVTALLLQEAGLEPGEDEALLDLPLEELKRVFLAIASNANTPLLGGEPYHPALDDTVLPKHPLDNLAPVSALIGHCENEAMTFARMASLIEGFPKKIRSKIGDALWQGLEETYAATARPERDPGLDLFSDCFTGIPSLRLANGLKALGASVWSYRFDYQNASVIGAAHATDLGFTFGKPGHAPIPHAEWDEEARRLSDQMRDAFIAFVRTGDPQTEALPQWPEHDAEGLAYLSFDAEPVVRSDFVGAARRAAWGDIPMDVV